MITIDVRNNFPEVKAALADAGKQVPFALARALTRTGQQVKVAEVEEMRRTFDRPTNFTLNALYLKTATKADLQARVFFKDTGTRPHFLLPQIEGGDRPLKRFEQRLVRAGYMYPNEVAVPAAGARLDSYGNVSRGQIVQILSQLQTAAVVGDFSDATNSKRSRAKRAKEAYFVSRGKGTWVGGGAWKNGEKSQHLPRGVWLRRSFGPLGTAVRPVLLFVRKPLHYVKRFKFFELGQRVVDQNFQANFNESFADALRTAKFTSTPSQP